MIITVTDFDVPFVYLTVNAAIKELAHNLNTPCITYKKQDFFARNIAKYNGPCIFIIEAAYLEHGRFSIRELKQFYPKAKVVVLGSDTFYHISRGTFQIDNPADTDLWLDLMSDCVNEYSKYTKTDVWSWTLNKPMNDYLLRFAKDNRRIKPKTTFISVLGQHTVERGYRKKLIKFIEKNGFTFTRGDSGGYNDPDMDKLYRSYLECYYTLGTSSHDNGMRSQKGFRNEVGIMLGRLLITDDFPDTKKQYGLTTPYYEYDDLDTLLHLLKIYPPKGDNYRLALRKQQSYAVHNTIEIQLERLLRKHEII
jgi:hypothetical protein